MGSGEIALIDAIAKRAAGASGGRGPVRVGIGDDCAVLGVKKGSEIVITTDFSLENRHFRRGFHPPESVGHRCLARGLSDLAAMGAKPLAAFLSLALPAGTTRRVAGRRWVARFLDGLLALAEENGVSLAGGDTSTAPGEEILADIVLVGEVPAGKALLRSGARVGDGLFVTGRLGASAEEFARLSKNPKRFRSAKAGEDRPHLFPVPRLEVGQALLRRGLASAAMDISDGLSTDLAHLCKASKVGATVDIAALPLGGTLEQALHGGEDYELLFTSAKAVPRLIAGVPITRIGTVEKRGLRLRDANGKTTPLKPGGWEHGL